ncbi:hypothetical protein AN944_02910 [Shewanella sp. P1-14-1]|uniref:hypothetical protein n=1 Tax=Shewanella TaxID=22 RepID=UPI0006D672A4|nr:MULTISPECIES: hypothetical protein [Shewanella]KPZ69391.1 hypothetical protein AN944_02910 [Shewanella sp. P1-14-1]
MTIFTARDLTEKLLLTANKFRMGYEWEAGVELKDHTNSDIKELIAVINKSNVVDKLKNTILQLLANTMSSISAAQERRDWCGMADFIQFDLVSIIHIVNTQLKE